MVYLLKEPNRKGEFPLTTLLLFISIVLLSCSLLKKMSGRLGIPSLLTFILLGMLLGSDGLFKIPFEDYQFAEQLSTLALLFIMFYGGFGTSWNAAKPAAAASIMLSSVGTIITALLTGLFCHFVLNMPLLEGFLCGAMLGSTDAASVFSILRSRKLALKENTAPLLEVESGSNDPFAYMLTAVLLTAMETGITPVTALGLLLGQILFGLLFGFGIGLFIRWLMQKQPFDTFAMETIFIVAVALFSYAAPASLGGNGFLSVYIVGILLGNSKLPDKTSLVPFFDGVTGTMQALLFFLLGLLSFPSRMLHVLLPALGLSLFLMLAARPAAVFLCMVPFSGSLAKRVLISFSGLRGAASIAFAITAVLSPARMENDLFHIVFVAVLFSIAVQGSLLPAVSKRLNMIDEHGDVLKTFTDYVDETPVNFIEFEIEGAHPWCGKRVSELTLPPNSILVNLKRKNMQMVPKGNTHLHAGDSIVMCALERENKPDFFLTEKILQNGDLDFGTSLSALPHEPGSLVVLIQRGHEYLIPDGRTQLRIGDRLLLHHTENI